MGFGKEWRKCKELLRYILVVLATELKNNANKLAKLTAQALLASADLMKIGYVSRVHPRDHYNHVILSVIGYQSRGFADQFKYCKRGTFIDSDLRRTLKNSGEGIFKLAVGEMCNRSPRTISPDAMAVEAWSRPCLQPVVDDINTVIGIITLYGLVSAGL